MINILHLSFCNLNLEKITFKQYNDFKTIIWKSAVHLSDTNRLNFMIKKVRNNRNAIIVQHEVYGVNKFIEDICEEYHAQFIFD